MGRCLTGFSGGGGFGMMGLFGLVLLGWVLWLVFGAMKRNQHTHEAQPNRMDTSSGNALEVLKKRFVNGEVSEEEYLQKLNVLKTK